MSSVSSHSGGLEDRVASIIEALLAGDAHALDRECEANADIAAELRVQVGKLAELDLIPPAIESENAAATSLGEFRLLARLGGGGMGVVHLARQDSLGRVVALKVLRADLATTAASRERFRREAAAVAALSHPSIVPMYAYGEVEGTAFLAMEFITGCSLAEVLLALRGREVATLSGRDLAEIAGCVGRPGFTGGYVEACVHVARQIASALEHAHSRGVLHRDVKPSNVMIDGTGRALLVDFGLARSMDDLPLTATQAVVGSLYWMAPERLSSDATDDARCDVYGLGATLYHLLALRPPYEARDPARLAALIGAGDFSPLRSIHPRISRDAALVCEMAIDPEPSRRYPSATELLRDLDAVLGYGAVTVRRVGPLRFLRRYVKRNPWRALAALLALLLLFVTPTGLWLQSTIARKRLDDAFEATKRALLQAKTERDAKQTALDALQVATDLSERAQLIESAKRLWPAEPSQVGGEAGMDAWLARGRQLLARLTARRALPEADAAIPMLEATVDDVSRRRAFALDLPRRTIEEPTVAAAWSSASERIARSGFHSGFTLRPQIGLVPLGPDPNSHFEEFAVLATGAPPTRRIDSGALSITAESACVLVLLPGGEFRMGAWTPDRAPTKDDPRVDVNAEADESPPNPVVLAPFFIGKHEMTQGQWERVAHGNPSASRAGTVYSGQVIDASNPVESITRLEAIETLARVGLVLPTEAQWEYAARGGTDTPWWTGAAKESLAGAANLADRTLAIEGHSSLLCEEWLDDGFIVHAPVGSLRANPFGLHDVVGNVREFCADGYGPYSNPPRLGDGLRSPSDPTTFVVRDAAFMNRASGATSSQRSPAAADTRAPGTGVRVARIVRD